MKLIFHDDDTHAYWLDGKRVKSASNVADIPTEKFNVEQWRDRMIAIGMTVDDALRERVAADLNNKRTIQTVAEDAKRAAKAHARADRGSQRHRVLELMLLGRTDQFITDQQRADAEVLARTLDAYGLEPMPDYVEQFVAYPDDGVVGRFDAVLWETARKRAVLCDLKGGINAVKYPHSTATQLAIYRFAPHVSAAIKRDGHKCIVNEWHGFPDELDAEVGYVIYCDDDHEIGELWSIDLQRGKVAADLAFSIIEWRKHNTDKKRDVYDDNDNYITYGDYGNGLATKLAAPANPQAVEQRTAPAGDRTDPAGAANRKPPGRQALRRAHERGELDRDELRKRYANLPQDCQTYFKALQIPPDNLPAIAYEISMLEDGKSSLGQTAAKQ